MEIPQIKDIEFKIKNILGKSKIGSLKSI